MRMSKNQMFDNFDSIMAHLKEIEPSESFNTAFRKRLQAAVIKRGEENVFEKLSRVTLVRAEELGYAFSRSRSIPAYAAAICTFIAIIGIYYYSL